jgi:hypothetical protein
MRNAAEASERSAARGFAFALITVLLSAGISLAVAEWVLRYQRQQIETSDRMDPGMILYDSRLGWRLAPNWKGKHHNSDFDATYSVNRFGLRGGSGDPSGPGAVALVGDSFTFGQGVNDEETFVHHLNRISAGTRTHLNFSVPGYSTDQQLLLLRQRVWLFRPEMVVLVVYLGNDLFDNRLTYPLQGEQGKPRFRLRADDRLELGNVPVPRAGKPAAARGKTLSSVVLGDAAAQPTGLAGWLGRLEIARRLGVLQSEPAIADAEMDERFRPALRLFRAIVTSMSEEAQRHGAGFGVALLAGKSFVREPRSLSARYQDHLRRGILEDLTEVPVLDLASRLREVHEAGTGGDLYYPNEGHLTPRGNRLVAQWLAQWLENGRKVLDKP